MHWNFDISYQKDSLGLKIKKEIGTRMKFLSLNGINSHLKWVLTERSCKYAIFIISIVQNSNALVSFQY